MRISNVRIREDGESVSLTAECQIRYVGSDEVYFKFDKKYREAISTDASAFAAAGVTRSGKSELHSIAAPPCNLSPGISPLN